MDRDIRQKLIMRAIDRPGVTSVQSLVELTGVSAITIRRDLSDLESLGQLQRVHGGARRVAKRGMPQPFGVRKREDREAKQLMAVAVANLIADDESVILDNGTSCEAVAKQLVGRPITAMCLSLHGAVALGSRSGPSIFVPGGPVENDTLAISGPSVVNSIREFYADTVVLGSCSTSIEHGLATTTHQDAENKRAAIAAARRRILVVTPRKLNRVSIFRFGGIEDLHQLVTTSDAPAEVLDEIAAMGVEVIIVPGVGGR